MTCPRGRCTLYLYYARVAFAYGRHEVRVVIPVISLPFVIKTVATPLAGRVLSVQVSVCPATVERRLDGSRDCLLNSGRQKILKAREYQLYNPCYYC